MKNTKINNELIKNAWNDWSDNYSSGGKLKH